MFNDNHPEDEVLEQYAMGKLTQAAVDSFEDHILVCAFCQDRLEFTETYLRGMKSALASDPRRKGPAKPTKTKPKKPLLTRTASGEQS